MCAVDAPVQSGMHHKTGRVDAVRGTVQHLALQVDLHQVAGRDLAVVQAEWVDQKLLVVTAHAVRQAHGEVVVNHLSPAQHGEHAVASRQLNAGGPFVGVKTVAHDELAQYTWPLALAGAAPPKPSLYLAAKAEVWRDKIMLSTPTATNKAPNDRY